MKSHPSFPPYVYNVVVDSTDDGYNCFHTWLRENNIKRFTFQWSPYEDKIIGIYNQKILFRFENEEDKVKFGLRWA